MVRVNCKNACPTSKNRPRKIVHRKHYKWDSNSCLHQPVTYAGFEFVAALHRRTGIEPFHHRSTVLNCCCSTLGVGICKLVSQWFRTAFVSFSCLLANTTVTTISYRFSIRGVIWICNGMQPNINDVITTSRSVFWQFA